MDGLDADPKLMVSLFVGNEMQQMQVFLP